MQASIEKQIIRVRVRRSHVAQDSSLSLNSYVFQACGKLFKSKALAQAALAEDLVWKAKCERWDKTKALREQFEAVERPCSELFNKGNHMRHQGHQDAWLLCASALDNAAQTACERGFELEGLEYWDCALSSLQSLACDASPRVRRWLKKVGLRF